MNQKASRTRKVARELELLHEALDDLEDLIYAIADSSQRPLLLLALSDAREAALDLADACGLCTPSHRPADGQAGGREAEPPPAGGD